MRSIYNDKEKSSMTEYRKKKSIMNSRLLDAKTREFVSLGMFDDRKNSYTESTLFRKGTHIILERGKFPFESVRDLFGREGTNAHVFGYKNNENQVVDVAVVLRSVLSTLAR